MSGLPDHEYLQCGAKMVLGSQDAFPESDLIVKVKEPLPHEWALLHEGQTIFTYFHLAASLGLTKNNTGQQGNLRNI